MSLVNQNWWFTTLLVRSHKFCPPLSTSLKCDVLIVGGGSAGRSAGFLTPDSELELHHLVRRYGAEAAREIWDAPLRGIERLVNGIKKFNIECGLVERPVRQLQTIGQSQAQDLDRDRPQRAA